MVRLTFALNQISAALGIKMGYVYLVIPLAGALVIYYSAGFIVQAVSEKLVLSPDELIDDERSRAHPAGR